MHEPSFWDFFIPFKSTMIVMWLSEIYDQTRSLIYKKKLIWESSMRLVQNSRRVHFLSKASLILLHKGLQNAGFCDVHTVHISPHQFPLHNIHIIKLSAILILVSYIWMSFSTSTTTSIILSHIRERNKRQIQCNESICYKKHFLL